MITKLAALVIFCAPLTLPAPQAVTQNKVTYQRHMLAEDGETLLALCGTAVRDKRFVLNIDVYAYGLYVEEQAARESLARWKGKSAKALAKDPSFYRELCKDNFTKTMRIVFLRGVDSIKVEEAFSEVLGPRIQQAVKKYHMPDAQRELAAFRKLFGAGVFAKGDEILLTWTPENQLIVTTKQKRHEPIVSPGLCWALLDVYLGQDPIETKGKRTLVQYVPDVLK